MRGRLPYIFLALMLFTSIGILAYANRDKFIPLTTLPKLNQNEQIWFLSDLSSYNLVVEITYGFEKREHAVLVKNYQLVQASVRYWDSEKDQWGVSQAMGENAGDELTILGLFQTIRYELIENIRNEIRVIYNPVHGYPEYIYLGTVVQEGETIPSSEARIRVVMFSPIQ